VTLRKVERVAGNIEKREKMFLGVVKTMEAIKTLIENIGIPCFQCFLVENLIENID
jgi:hypothetical protein